MSNRSRLGELADSELLAGLSELVHQGNELTVQLLEHLIELEQRMLHLELGFSSLFAYCVEALGMSEGSAGRRVAAARMCRKFPQLLQRLTRGELHLCALCALAPHVNQENAAELFDACRGKTRRQVEELLAARYPRPDVRAQIRRIPAPTPASAAPCPPISVPLRPAKSVLAATPGRSVYPGDESLSAAKPAAHPVARPPIQSQPRRSKKGPRRRPIPSSLYLRLRGPALDARPASSSR